MSMMITDACINCGVCEPECPNEAIREGEEQFFVRQGLCTECVGEHETPQCLTLCPIEGAVVVNAHRGETRSQLEQKAKRIQLKRAFEAYDKAQSMT